MGDLPQFTERHVVEAVNELKTAVNKFSEDSSRWSKRLAWLAAVMLVAVGVQIIIMIRDLPDTL